MAFFRRFAFVPVGAAMAVSAAGVVLVAFASGSSGCIDGTTPNCAADAGCGPGIDAAAFDAVSADARTTSDAKTTSDAQPSDAMPSGDASDASPDATSSTPDAGPDSAAEGGVTPTDAAPLDSATQG